MYMMRSKSSFFKVRIVGFTDPSPADLPEAEDSEPLLPSLGHSRRMEARCFRHSAATEQLQALS